MEESMRYPRWANRIALCLILVGSPLRAQETSPPSGAEAPALSIRLGAPVPVRAPVPLSVSEASCEPLAPRVIGLGRPRSLVDSADLGADDPPARLFCLSPVRQTDSAL